MPIDNEILRSEIEKLSNRRTELQTELFQINEKIHGLKSIRNTQLVEVGRDEDDKPIIEEQPIQLMDSVTHEPMSDNRREEIYNSLMKK